MISGKGSGTHNPCHQCDLCETITHAYSATEVGYCRITQRYWKIGVLSKRRFVTIDTPYRGLWYAVSWMSVRRFVFWRNFVISPHPSLGMSPVFMGFPPISSEGWGVKQKKLFFWKNRILAATFETKICPFLLEIKNILVILQTHRVAKFSRWRCSKRADLEILMVNNSISYLFRDSWNLGNFMM